MKHCDLSKTSMQPILTFYKNHEEILYIVPTVYYYFLSKSFKC